VKLNIKINDKTYEVDVEAAEPDAPNHAPRGYVMESAPVRVPAAPLAAPPVQSGGAVNEEKVCRSPVSGNVVRVMAHAGQSIQVGDVLLVLEAMKMETNITAPVSGKLAAVKVNAGDSVQSGQVVVEFE
jgi:methylmalonyl-CoA carboxyltransferase small subunit